MKVAPTPQHYWDLRAAGNFILGGAGSALLAWTAVGSLLGNGRGAALALGTLLVAGGLLLVWFEIGRPERFLNVLRNPRTSWMSREAWAALALLPLTASAMITGATGLLVASGLLALIFLYCQARILYASRGIPAWRLGESVPLIIATGLVEGGALYLVLHPGINAELAIPGVLLVLLRLLFWRRFIAALEHAAPRASVRVMRRFDLPFLLAGHALPLAAIGAAWLLPSSTVAIPAAAILAAASALLSGWAMKYLLVVHAAHTEGFAITHTPSRGCRHGGAGIKPGWNR